VDDTALLLPSATDATTSLKSFSDSASHLGLNISWPKTKLQNIGSGYKPPDISVGRYQKGKTNLDFTEARDSECQWYQLAYVQVCTSLQTDNHASTPPLSFLQAGCPSCRPTNSVKALKAPF